jgi:hypothetical protein
MPEIVRKGFLPQKAQRAQRISLLLISIIPSHFQQNLIST